MKTTARLHFTIGAAFALSLAGFGCTSVLGDITFDRSTGGGGSGGGSGGATSSSSSSGTGGGTGGATSSSTSSSSGTGGMATCATTTCDPLATCDDTSGTPKCTCPSGYNDDNGDGTKCTDFDECKGEGGGNDCGAQQVCTNTAGSFTCACPAGSYEFPAGSKLCPDDPCLPDPCNGHGACSNGTGKELCTCQSGFIGDHCESCVYFVDGAATGTNNGTSWANAFTSIQAAITEANKQVTMMGEPSCDVWVKAGTYYVYATDIRDTISLKTNVGLYGGFAGTEKARTEANPTANKTILDGRKNGSSNLRVLHVVGHFDEVSTTIDGFTIQNGAANPTSSEEDRHGGGILLYAFHTDGTLNVSRCEITGNSGTYGGGIATMWGNPSVVVKDSNIHDNTAGAAGGGLSCGGKSCTVTGTTFRGNIATGSNAGGMDCSGTLCTVTGSTFRGNIAGGEGGGLVVSTALIADNVTFADNIAAGEGGGVKMNGVNNSLVGTTLTNLVFIGNKSGAGGGGLRVVANNSGVSVYNGVFVGNQAQYGGGLSSDAPVAFGCYGCTVTANLGTSSADGVQWGGIYSVAPTLVNTIVWGNPSVSAPKQDISPVDWTKISASHSDIHGYGGTDTSVVDANPMFTSLPAFFDRTTVATSNTTTIMVAAGTSYKVGDVLEIAGDGVARTVSQIVANTITFTPALTTPAVAGASIRNWGAALGTIDLHLQTGSVCVDAADNTGLTTDVEGTAQKGAARDIGAYESH